jgi:hypothetical protein
VTVTELAEVTELAMYKDTDALQSSEGLATVQQLYTEVLRRVKIMNHSLSCVNQIVKVFFLTKYYSFFHH